MDCGTLILDMTCCWASWIGTFIKLVRIESDDGTTDIFDPYDWGDAAIAVADVWESIDDDDLDCCCWDREDGIEVGNEACDRGGIDDDEETSVTDFNI